MKKLSLLLLLMASLPVSAYESVEQCRQEFSVWIPGYGTSSHASSGLICDCADKRSEESEISNRDLLLCMHQQTQERAQQRGIIGKGYL